MLESTWILQNIGRDLLESSINRIESIRGNRKLSIKLEEVSKMNIEQFVKELGMK